MTNLEVKSIEARQAIEALIAEYEKEKGRSVTSVFINMIEATSVGDARKVMVLGRIKLESFEEYTI